MRVIAAGGIASAPAAEKLFNEIYAEHGRRVNQYLYWHLPEGIRGRAEDLAQEVFACLWEHLVKGKEVKYPFALLKRIAQRRIADQLAIRSRDADSVLVDVTDTEAATVETVGCSSRYASGEPELALVAAELDTAMERMREASERWRDLHGKAGHMKARPRRYPDRPDPNPSRTAKVEAGRIEIRLRRDEALVELQEACRVVGNLRAELERIGGGCWQSSSGWPPSPERDGRKRYGALSDPTVKVCPKQHCLADIERVSFLEDGTRVCRACTKDTTSRYRDRQAATA